MATGVSEVEQPACDIDLFADDALQNPYPLYDEIRDLGGAVWMSRYKMYALSRFHSLKKALADDSTFISGEGVTMNEQMNRNLKGITLCSDGEAHMKMRRVIAKPLSPASLKALTAEIEHEATTLIERLVARQRFNAVTDLARHLPITVVSNLVGLPEEGRERMLVWSEANFNCFGPMNERTASAFPVVGEMLHYAFNECKPGSLKPGGWAQMIWDAADRGEILHHQCAGMMNDYMGPALDTTISATCSLIIRFAQNPDQWLALRENPYLIPSAINEGVRVDSPILMFSRYVARDTEVDGAPLPAGARALMMYAAANRDERRFDNPNRFDIRRRVTDHLGFGFGPHQCVGSNLARLEISSLLKALVSRVERITLHSTQRHLHNMVQLYSDIDVSLS